MNDHRRVSIVTGGGTGIGAAIARRLANGGNAVTLVGRREELIREVAAEVVASGGDALPITADLADPTVPARIVAATVEHWGRLDVIVNNAAVLWNGLLQDIQVEVLDQHYAVNVRAPWLLVQAAAPWLRKSGAGAIVNISSASANLSIRGQSVYGSTKATLEYLTRSWAVELAPTVRVNCIAPGPVDTPIHLSWAADMKTAYDGLRKATPLGQIGSADNIASWAERLCDPNESFVTGAVMTVDGGQTLNGWSADWQH